MTQILKSFDIGESIQSIVMDAESKLGSIYRSVEETAEANQYKVIDAMRQENVSPRHFNPTTGYGYSDATFSGRVVETNSPLHELGDYADCWCRNDFGKISPNEKRR